MPQLDFNTFAGVAGGITIIFYLSYVGFLIYPFARIIASEKAAYKYRLGRIILLAEAAEEIKKNSKNEKTN